MRIPRDFGKRESNDNVMKSIMSVQMDIGLVNGTSNLF
jgi:hypothetical protein